MAENVRTLYENGRVLNMYLVIIALRLKSPSVFVRLVGSLYDFPIYARLGLSKFIRTIY